jgi:hypothetical protein
MAVHIPYSHRAQCTILDGSWQSIESLDTRRRHVVRAACCTWIIRGREINRSAHMLRWGRKVDSWFEVDDVLLEMLRDGVRKRADV